VNTAQSLHLTKYVNFRYLSKLCANDSREYLNSNLVYCIISSSASKDTEIKGVKIIQ